MNYKVIGYEHKEGISKKNNKAYNIDIFHCVIENPIPSDSGFGNRVEVVVYNAGINGSLESVPAIGDYIEPKYNRQGFICDISSSKI